MAGKVLLVEDDADIRFAYEIILKRAGYDLAVAQNGKEALDLVVAHDPRLILLDIFMPVMDGREFLEQLDPVHFTNRIIVVCSNTSDEEVISSMKRLGAHHVVLKASLNPDGLIGLVANYIDSESALKSNG